MYILYHDRADVGIAKGGESCYNFSMDTKRIFGYEPIVDGFSRFLVLGTMPSVVSLAEGFYYAHPRNAFWPIMAEIFGRSRPETVDDKRRLLLENRIALWDVSASCIREGSLDSAIRDVRLNDVGALLRDHPTIEKVLLNGGTAWKLYHRLPEEVVSLRPCEKLPSTSPAYTIKYEEKLLAWKAALTGGGISI